MTECPFCDKEGIKNRTFLETENFNIIYDKYPLVEGHCLVIPKRHIESTFEFRGDEIEELIDILNKATKIILKTFNLDDFNWVLNMGEYAGQKVDHVHFHIIPRKRGDLGEDPRNFFVRLTENQDLGQIEEISGGKLKKIIKMLRKNVDKS